MTADSGLDGSCLLLPWLFSLNVFPNIPQKETVPAVFPPSLSLSHQGLNLVLTQVWDPWEARGTVTLP